MWHRSTTLLSRARKHDSESRATSGDRYIRCRQRLQERLDRQNESFMRIVRPASSGPIRQSGRCQTAATNEAGTNASSFPAMPMSGLTRVVVAGRVKRNLTSFCIRSSFPVGRPPYGEQSRPSPQRPEFPTPFLLPDRYIRMANRSRT